MTASTADREQIVDLVVRYGRACDTKDWKLLESCFAPDSVVRYSQFGPPFTGHKELEDYLRMALDALDGTQHLFTNYAIETDGDRGHFRVSLHAQHVKRSVQNETWCAVGGTYEIDVARVDGGWKMTGMQFEPIWMSGNPEVLGHILDDDHTL